MDKKVDIIQDLEGRKVVIIHDILFKGKRTFDWDDVKKYLKEFIGERFEITEYADAIEQYFSSFDNVSSLYCSSS